MKHWYSLCFILCLAFFPNTSAAQVDEEDFTLFSRWIDWSSPASMLAWHLNEENLRLLAERESIVAQTVSKDDWLKRRDEIRATLKRIVGPFPERSGLNTKISRIIQRDGYRVEKLVYESLPEFHVTAALFIPDGIRDPRPGILNVIGHSAQAFRRDTYQNVILNLVAKGFVVLAIDPLGQGERLQYFDPETGESSVGSSTREHSYVGNQCLLSGYSVSRYFIWDGMRGIDYLQSRPEVDASRIGVTGLSGGGTQTALIAAMDERVSVAVPTCYITGYRRLLQSIGPQDGEQNLFHALANGIDHAELLVARIPKPTLVVATTRDFFSIQGVHETSDELARAYNTLGVADHFDQVEDDFGHGFTKKNNEATYAFLQKHLGLPGDSSERDIPALAEDDLLVTSTGQLSTSLKSRTVFDLNLEVAEPLVERLATFRKKSREHLKSSLEAARKLSGFRAPKETAKPVYRGRYKRSGYVIEKHALPGEGKTVIPLLVFLPIAAGPHPAIIYCHPEGKQVDSNSGGEIEKLVIAGHVVAAPDPLGVGETASGIRSSHLLVAPFFNAQLSARSLVGINAADIIRVLNYLKSRSEVQNDRIGIVGAGDLGPAALLAASLEPSFRSLTLVKAPLSYASVVLNRHYQLHANSFIAGALTSFDLPDLVANIAPRRLALVSPTDQMKNSAHAELLVTELEFPRRAYQSENASENLKVFEDIVPLLRAVAWSLE